MEAIAERWNAGDTLGALERFTDDAVYMEPPDEQRYEGRDELFEFFGGDDPSPMHMEWHHLVVDGDVGVGEYTYRGHGPVPRPRDRQGPRRADQPLAGVPAALGPPLGGVRRARAGSSRSQAAAPGHHSVTIRCSTVPPTRARPAPPAARRAPPRARRRDRPSRQRRRRTNAIASSRRSNPPERGARLVLATDGDAELADRADREVVGGRAGRVVRGRGSVRHRSAIHASGCVARDLDDDAPARVVGRAPGRTARGRRRCTGRGRTPRRRPARRVRARRPATAPSTAPASTPAPPPTARKDSSMSADPSTPMIRSRAARRAAARSPRRRRRRRARRRPSGSASRRARRGRRARFDRGLGPAAEQLGREAPTATRAPRRGSRRGSPRPASSPRQRSSAFTPSSSAATSSVCSPSRGAGAGRAGRGRRRGSDRRPVAAVRARDRRPPGSSPRPRARRRPRRAFAPARTGPTRPRAPRATRRPAASRERLRQDRDQLVAVAHAGLVGREPLVGGELGPPDHARTSARRAGRSPRPG